MSNEKKKKMDTFAQQIRIETLKQLKARGFGHAGGRAVGGGRAGGAVRRSHEDRSGESDVERA